MSNAFVASALLHGGIVGLLFLWAVFFGNREPDTKIIELVAGPGNNYGATVAAALGSPDSTTNDPAAAEAQAETPAPPRALEAVAAPMTPAQKPLAKAPDFTRQIVNISKRVEKRALLKFEKEQKAKAEAEEKARLAAEKEQTANQNRMTKAEFDKRYGSKLNPNPASAPFKTLKIDTKGIASGVSGGSTENAKGGVGGTAISREEGDMLDAYFSLLIQRLKEAHERPTGVSDLLSAQAEFLISHDGTISGVRISRSSGSPEFDQSILSAFRNVGSIGPRPDGGGTLVKRVTFKMKDD